MEVKMIDFREAIKEIEPSALREIYVEVPEVSWEQVGGLEEVKERLKESIEWHYSARDVRTFRNQSSSWNRILEP